MDVASVSSECGHLAENLAPRGCLVHILGMMVHEESLKSGRWVQVFSVQAFCLR